MTTPGSSGARLLGGSPPSSLAISRRPRAVLHPALRVPGVHGFSRRATIDYEDRPYHLGWVLYVLVECTRRALHAGGSEVSAGVRHQPAPTRSLFGIPVAAVTMAEALDIVDAAIIARRPLQIGVINAAKVVNMRRDAGLRNAVLSSDIIFADGISVVWASRALGQPLPERVAGIDLMTGILRRGQRAPVSRLLPGRDRRRAARYSRADPPSFRASTWSVSTMGTSPGRKRSNWCRADRRMRGRTSSSWP